MFEPAGEVASAHPFVFGLWSAVSAADWLLLLLLAGLAVIIGLTLAGAYQVASPSSIATFEYSYLIFAVFWDLVFFRVIPTGTSMLGMLMIVIAGMMVLQRSGRNAAVRPVDFSATA
jgi:drug/metabolite transporter (DMT)-like permease